MSQIMDTMKPPPPPPPQPVTLTRQEDGTFTFPIDPPAYLSVDAFRAEYRRHLLKTPPDELP